MSSSHAESELSGRRLSLPTDLEVLRNLRHELRTPINPILGYCELIVEEAGEAAPESFLAGMRELHGAGSRMLKLTNEIFSDQPSAFRELDCAALKRLFRKPAEQATGLSGALAAQAAAAGLPVAVKDLHRIGVATGRWLERVERMLVESCR